MKKTFSPAPIILFFNCCLAQQKFQLAPPILQYSSAFFAESATASLRFDQPGTTIFYTLNNKEPAESDRVYRKPIRITKSLTTLKAKVIGKEFIASETVKATFIKDGLKIISTKQSLPNERFPGSGPNTLFDNEGGIANLHSKNFFGYQQDSVVIDITLEKKEKINSVLLDFLCDHSSWIFLPQSIWIFFFDKEKNTYELIDRKEISAESIIKGSTTVFEIIKAGKKITANKLKIILIPLQSIPGEHPGKGKQSWLFIDEIKVY